MIFDDNEKRYYNDIKDYGVLSEGEQLQLVKDIKNSPNEKKLIEKLVVSNLRFVIKVAKKYRNKGLSMPELINEGNLGLIKAAFKFDPSEDIKFISYAVWWIRQSIQKALYEQIHLIKIPSNKYSFYKKFEEQLRHNEYDVEATLAMDEFKSSREELTDIWNKIRMVSLDSSLNVSNNDDVEVTLMDSLAIDADQEDLAYSKEVRAFMLKVIENILSEREKKVIKMYYGLEYEREYTLEELGVELQLTKERIRQIKKKALKKLFAHPDLQSFLTFK